MIIFLMHVSCVLTVIKLSWVNNIMLDCCYVKYLLVTCISGPFCRYFVVCCCILPSLQKTLAKEVLLALKPHERSLLGLYSLTDCVGITMLKNRGKSFILFLDSSILSIEKKVRKEICNLNLIFA